MPTNRRAITRRRGGSPVTLDRLGEFLFLERDNSGDLDQEQAEDIWAYHGERILAEWIAKRPGTRPWCFWVFDVEAERPILKPLDPETEAMVRGHSSFFGVLVNDFYQESEVSYLRRNNILTDTEIEILGSSD
jgi:hypothetical protein